VSDCSKKRGLQVERDVIAQKNSIVTHYWHWHGADASAAAQKLQATAAAAACTCLHACVCACASVCVCVEREDTNKNTRESALWQAEHAPSPDTRSSSSCSRRDINSLWLLLLLQQLTVAARKRNTPRCSQAQQTPAYVPPCPPALSLRSRVCVMSRAILVVCDCCKGKADDSPPIRKPAASK
jgi:hypothetical protein